LEWERALQNGLRIGYCGGQTKIGDVDKAGALSFALGSSNWPEADNKSGKKRGNGELIPSSTYRMQFVVVDFSVCLRLKSRFDFSLLFKIYLNVCPAHTQWENKNPFWLRYFLSIRKKKFVFNR